MARLGYLGMSAMLLAGAAQAEVTISAKPTANISCAAGVCTPTAKKAVLNAGELAGMLASGDVAVNSAGSLAKDIAVKAALSWASTNRLTLDAYQSVTVTKPVSVTGTGALTIITNNGGTGGDLSFDGKGRIVFWDMTSSLIINGQSFTLVKTLKALKSAVKANNKGAYALADNVNAAKSGVLKKAPIKSLFGTLEGLGNVISNLTITSVDHNPPPIGLIGANSGLVRDLGLRNVSIKGSAGQTASLVGSNVGVVRNCYAEGTVSGPFAGGLVGENFGGGMIIHSHTNVSIQGSGGGLAFGNGALIETSFAVGPVAAGGGLVEENVGAISQSYATGAVGVGGGLVGYHGNGGPAVIENSYATGSVSGDSAGGLVNTTEAGFGARIATSYSTGHVSGANAGGLIGNDEAPNNSDTYWDLDTSGISDPSQGAGNIKNDPGITGLTTEQLQSELPAGFDPTIWGRRSGINNGFPYLLAIPPG